MLKITAKVLEQSLTEHKGGIVDWVERTSDFYFDLLSNKSITTSLTTCYRLHGNTLNSLANNILDAKITNGILINHFNKTAIVKFKQPIPKKLLQLLEYLKNNAEHIITGKPEKLQDIKKVIDCHFSTVWTENEDMTNSIMESVFDYEKFIDRTGFKNAKSNTYEAYHLAQNLGTKTCLYCNRLYANTIYNKNEDKRIIRPEFDHFFDKEEHPYFGLSFYNLIPSCKTCNSTLKHIKKFSLDKNLHPYLNEFTEFVKFTYYPQTTEAAYGVTAEILVKIISKDLKIAIDKRVEGNIGIFKLETVYSDHSDLVQDLILKAVGTNWKYLKVLKDTFEWEITEEELHRIAFGVYPNEEDFHKRPFSQMTNDIARELGLIS